jgi:hypothetical protein
MPHKPGKRISNLGRVEPFLPHWFNQNIKKWSQLTIPIFPIDRMNISLGHSMGGNLVVRLAGEWGNGRQPCP